MKQFLKKEEQFLSAISTKSDKSSLAIQERIKEFESRRRQIEKEILNLQTQLSTANQSISKYTTLLPIMTERSETMKKLMGQKIISRFQYYDYETERLTMQEDLKLEKLKVPTIEASIAGQKESLKGVGADYRWRAQQKIDEYKMEATRLQNELNNQQTISEHTLYAPVNGTVQNLQLHNENGVVTAAQPLMEIVPSDSPLSVEAFVANRDIIGFLSKDQDVRVKVDAFPFLLVTGQSMQL